MERETPGQRPQPNYGHPHGSLHWPSQNPPLRRHEGGQLESTRHPLRTVRRSLVKPLVRGAVVSRFRRATFGG